RIPSRTFRPVDWSRSIDQYESSRSSGRHSLIQSLALSSTPVYDNVAMALFFVILLLWLAALILYFFTALLVHAECRARCLDVWAGLACLLWPLVAVLLLIFLRRVPWPTTLLGPLFFGTLLVTPLAIVIQYIVLTQRKQQS